MQALTTTRPTLAHQCASTMRTHRHASTTAPTLRITRDTILSRASSRENDSSSASTSSDESPSGVSDISYPWAQPGYRGAVVSAMDERAQAAVVSAAWLAVCAATYECVTVVGPALDRAAPSLMAWSKSTWPIIGVTYVAAGVAHFAVHDGFVAMMPHDGAWGIWRLPGSKSFHVNWTGVAEILGGAGLMLGSLPFNLTPEALQPILTPASAACLAGLSMAVYPANLYMWTHNSPGPLPPDADESMLTLPWQGHLARAGLQVFLLSILIALARGA